MNVSSALYLSISFLSWNTITKYPKWKFQALFQEYNELKKILQGTICHFVKLNLWFNLINSNPLTFQMTLLLQQLLQMWWHQQTMTTINLATKLVIQTHVPYPQMSHVQKGEVEVQGLQVTFPYQAWIGIHKYVVISNFPFT